MIEFKQIAKSYGIDISNYMLDQFKQYMDVLLKWNEKINLTSITNTNDIIIKHFLDSILILKWIEIKKTAKIIDVGTGGGFPGIPLKIVRPDIQLTLLDSLNKRIIFLKEVSQVLNLDNICIHGRAEEVAHIKKHRENYDAAIARAVTSLPALSEYCLPLVRIGGLFIAMKGPNNDDELKTSFKAISAMGGHLENISIYALPDGSGRTLYSIKKESQTNIKYPRKHVKITKAPLI